MADEAIGDGAGGAGGCCETPLPLRGRRFFDAIHGLRFGRLAATCAAPMATALRTFGASEGRRGKPEDTERLAFGRRCMVSVVVPMTPAAQRSILRGMAKTPCRGTNAVGVWKRAEVHRKALCSAAPLRGAGRVLNAYRGCRCRGYPRRLTSTASPWPEGSVRGSPPRGMAKTPYQAGTCVAGTSSRSGRSGRSKEGTGCGLARSRPYAERWWVAGGVVLRGALWRGRGERCVAGIERRGGG